jgi:hypothetical protein
MRLVDAAYSRDKEEILVEVNAALNRIRFLLRLAKDLKLPGMRALAAGGGFSFYTGLWAKACGQLS